MEVMVGEAMKMNILIDYGQFTRLFVALSVSKRKRHWWKFWVKEPSTGTGLGFEYLQEDVKASAGQ